MFDNLKIALAILFPVVIAVFLACEGPAGPPGEDGAWMLIETITLTADTNIITFDDISDEWEVLEVRGVGSLTGADSTSPVYNNMFMRFNDDADSNYWCYGDRVVLQTWSTGTCNFIVDIIRDDGMPGNFSCNVESMFSNSAGSCFGSNSYSYYISPDSTYIWKVDIFSDPDTSQVIAAGSEFVLLGLDTD